MLQINWYDLAKDFAGPIITACSTIVALYLGLHKSKPKLGYSSYKKYEHIGLSNNDDVTIIEFFLLSNDVGWFKLKNLEFICGNHVEMFYLKELGKSYDNSTNHMIGNSLSTLREQIVLASDSPTLTDELDIPSILNELSKVSNQKTKNDILNSSSKIKLSLIFETNGNDKEVKIRI